MRIDRYILNEHGEPIPEPDLLIWGRFFELTDRRLARTEKDGVLVSTVFLGLDHNYADEGEPILWETMIFGGEHDEYQERYTSKEAALAGHKKACELAGIA